MTRKSGILFLVSALIAIVLSTNSWAGQGVDGTAKADKLDQCVAPTPFMRRSHFELILHQRDITVHQGIRKTDDSLAGCVDCHARKDESGKPVPINAEGEFCATCHEKAAVSIDCFSCHTTVPREK